MLLCMVSKLFILQILSRNISYQQKINWSYFIFLHSVLFQLILIRFFELFQINFFLFLLLSFFSPNVLLVYRSVCVSVCPPISPKFSIFPLFRLFPPLAIELSKIFFFSQEKDLSTDFPLKTFFHRY